jgi:hypothetical protein
MAHVLDSRFGIHWQQTLEHDSRAVVLSMPCSLSGCLVHGMVLMGLHSGGSTVCYWSLGHGIG